MTDSCYEWFLLEKILANKKIFRLVARLEKILYLCGGETKDL